MRGASFVIAIGKSGGLKITISGICVRVCLWYVAVTIYFIDIEAAIENLMKEANIKEERK